MCHIKGTLYTDLYSNALTSQGCSVLRYPTAIVIFDQSLYGEFPIEALFIFDFRYSAMIADVKELRLKIDTLEVRRKKLIVKDDSAQKVTWNFGFVRIRSP